MLSKDAIIYKKRDNHFTDKGDEGKTSRVEVYIDMGRQSCTRSIIQGAIVELSPQLGLVDFNPRLLGVLGILLLCAQSFGPSS